MQDSAIKFFDKLTGNLVNGINKCMLGKIESFDGETMKATVTPLIKQRAKDGEMEDRPLLIEVPVSFLKAGPFVIRPPYKPGDIVLIVFADEDMDNVLLSGDKSEPNSQRKHSLDDAIVVGGIMPFTATLPGEHLDDLIIAKDDFTAKIAIEESGDVLIQTDKGIKLKSDLDISIESEMDVTIKGKNIKENAGISIKRNAGASIDDEAPEINLN